LTHFHVARRAEVNLPDELQRAQEALEKDEVREMLRRLAEYNLGIFMPHIHDEESGAFSPLPDGYVQVEEDLKVRFVERAEAENLNSVPVAWVWDESAGDRREKAKCVQNCVYSWDRQGDRHHTTIHSS
jgi:hypothetical protein